MQWTDRNQFLHWRSPSCFVTEVHHMQDHTVALGIQVTIQQSRTFYIQHRTFPDGPAHGVREQGGMVGQAIKTVTAVDFGREIGNPRRSLLVENKPRDVRLWLAHPRCFGREAGECRYE